MLSLPKILLVLAILAAVIIGTRVFRSWSSIADKSGEDNGKGVKGNDGAVDMVKCEVCGDFIEPSAGSCGRENCPR